MPRRVDSPKSSTGPWLLLAVIGLLTVVAIGGLMKVRFDTGEAYPPYSSLRVDPLGTRALFEALGRLPNVTVERNFKKIERVEGAQGTTLVMCGLDARQFDSRNVVNANAVSRFVVSGGRLVIALSPSVSMDFVTRAYRDAEEENEKEEDSRREERRKARKAKSGTDDKKPESPPETKKPTADEKAKDTKAKDDAGKKKKAKSPMIQEDPSFAKSLKTSAKSKEFFYNSKEGAPLTPAAGLPLNAADLPGWFSNVYLDDTPGQNWTDDWRTLSDDKQRKKPDEAAKILPVEPSPWQVLATKGSRTMIAQRQLGSGTIVVCTDRYFLSNEALWSQSKPAFISWLLGNPQKVIFDETHFAKFIGDEDTIMTLARRYRMHGLFLGGLILFALFIWRSAFSLVPPTPEDDLGLWRTDAVAGRSAASGLEGLLRRGIPAGQLLQRCFEIWETTRAAVLAVSADRLAKAKALVSDPQVFKKPVTTYRELRDALHTNRKK